MGTGLVAVYFCCGYIVYRLDNAFVTMFHLADASIFTGMTGNKVHENHQNKS